jgi:glc operon protein GlcG
MTRHLIRLGAGAGLGAALACAADLRAQTSTSSSLTLDEARRVAMVAAREARASDAGGAVAVVDAGGHLLYLLRLDGTFPAAAAVAIEKARTAAVFRRPTRAFEEAIKNGRTPLLGVTVMTPLEGGVPIERSGQVVGAVGVSGAKSSQQDEELARAAAASLTMTGASVTGPVTQLPAAEVTAAFARGMPLVETGGYKVHASRREQAGQAEVHAEDTDIIYVLEGRATLVTGGTLVDGRTIGPGEVRGTSIAKGDVRQLAPGDVLIVPNGTPHWFRDILQPPFLYYVVKTTSTMGSGGTR